MTWAQLTPADHLAAASYLTKRARAQRRRQYEASATFLEKRAEKHLKAAG